LQKRGFVFLPGQELALAGAKNKTPAMAQPCGALLLGCFADRIRITERREVILGRSHAGLFSWAVLPTISGSPNEER